MHGLSVIPEDHVARLLPFDRDSILRLSAVGDEPVDEFLTLFLRPANDLCGMGGDK